MDQLCVEKGLSEFTCSLISWGLYFGYLLFGLALISAVVLPFLNALKNPKAIVKAGIGVGILLLVFALAFAVSGDEVNSVAASQGITTTGSKMIGAGLIMFYVALFAAILGLVYSEINKALK